MGLGLGWDGMGWGGGGWVGFGWGWDGMGWDVFEGCTGDRIHQNTVSTLNALGPRWVHCLGCAHVAALTFYRIMALLILLFVSQTIAIHNRLQSHSELVMTKVKAMQTYNPTNNYMHLVVFSTFLYSRIKFLNQTPHGQRVYSPAPSDFPLTWFCFLYSSLLNLFRVQH